MVDEIRDQQIRLVELDLAQTNDLIKGVTTIGAGIRTAAITTWLGLLGFAFQQRLWSLALLAAIVASAFYLVDSYHGRIYALALAHASRAESLIAQHYRYLSMGSDDPGIEVDLEAQLNIFRFGCYSSLKRLRIWGVLRARPGIVFWLLYPLLLVLALIFSYLIFKGYFGTPVPSK